MPRKNPKPSPHSARSLSCEIVILAGGLSSRMGRDKSRIRFGRRTLLGHIRATAAKLHLPVRVLRRDAVPRCGPLGGIYTALTASRAGAILFLACDMPFVTPALLNQLLRLFNHHTMAISQCPPSSPSPLNEERAGVRGAKVHSDKQKKKSEPVKKIVPALFTFHNQLFGLPCILHRETSLPIVSQQIANSRFSLQALARALKAKTLRPARNPAQLLNLNTPADLSSARKLLK